MFLFRASRYLDELKAFRPEMFEVCSKAMATAVQDLGYRIPKETFTTCRVGRSIMLCLKIQPMRSLFRWMLAGTILVLDFALGWSEKDGDGNACLGDVVVENTSNAFIRSDDKLVAAIGANDMVIVSTKDTVLVAHKDQVQKAKEVAVKLKRDGDRMGFASRKPATG